MCREDTPFISATALKVNFALEELLSLPQVVHQKKAPIGVMCFECGTVFGVL